MMEVLDACRGRYHTITGFLTRENVRGLVAPDPRIYQQYAASPTSNYVFDQGILALVLMETRPRDIKEIQDIGVIAEKFLNEEIFDHLLKFHGGVTVRSSLPPKTIQRLERILKGLRSRYLNIPIKTSLRQYFDTFEARDAEYIEEWSQKRAISIKYLKQQGLQRAFQEGHFIYLQLPRRMHFFADNGFFSLKDNPTAFTPNEFLQGLRRIREKVNEEEKEGIERGARHLKGGITANVIRIAVTACIQHPPQFFAATIAEINEAYDTFLADTSTKDIALQRLQGLISRFATEKADGIISCIKILEETESDILELCKEHLTLLFLITLGALDFGEHSIFQKT